MSELNKGDMDRIELTFANARLAIGRIESSRDEIEQRIDKTSMRTAPTAFFAGAIVVAAIAMSGMAIWWHATDRQPPLVNSPSTLTAPGTEGATIDLGDTQLREYIAAIVDQQVLVVWSYGGDGLTAAPATATECPAGKYRLTTLRQDKLEGGRTVVCSLFTPDEGVLPVLEPPSVYAQSGDDGIIALSVSPRAASTEELAGAIRLAGVGGKIGIGVDDILREAQRREKRGHS
jgi:hypothetical protein